MIAKLRPTVTQVFAFSLIGLVLGLAVLLYLLVEGSGRTILRSAEMDRDLASHEVAARVTEYLGEAPLAVEHFHQQVQYNLIQPRDPDSVESALLSLLLANKNISEATLTYAHDKRGGVSAGGGSCWQVAVLRSASNGEFLCRRSWFDRGRFLCQSSQRGMATQGAALELPVSVSDPTTDPTFETTASPEFYGQLLWTDLHWAQIDEGSPATKRRVEVSVQKTIEDSHGEFVGVVRIGLMKSLIDGAVRQNLTGGDERSPSLIFLCDNDGRLITGFGDRTKVMVSGDDLRIPAADVPPVVARALREPSLRTVSGDSPEAASSFRFGKQDYLYIFLALPRTQDWIVGIVVPRDYYMGELVAIRRHILEASVALILAICVAEGLIKRKVMKSQSLVLQETVKMNQFEFAPTHKTPWLRDVEEVLASLEKAKTAMRAMSKYVPVNLVRKLYRAGQEPVLGGKSAEISILFTDIKNFTSFSEQTSPDRVAEVLGLYLQAVTSAIQTEKGMIDKYIGDCVMALWNVPEETPGHEILACRAALRCKEALRELYDSPVWGDTPRFETRFGLHRCVASVGHFGAPDRFNYTTIGDGVNLGSRLESLNKFYGTTHIVSEAIHDKARNHFEFRLLDLVAVKGKKQRTRIYELIGEKIPGKALPEYVAAYERAFASYQLGKFEAALDVLENQLEDGPSRTLALRCKEFLKSPPRRWNGVWIFDVK